MLSLLRSLMALLLAAGALTLSGMPAQAATSHGPLSGGQTQVSSMQFLDTSHGFALFADETLRTNTSTLYATSDGGSTWAPVVLPVTADFLGLTFRSATSGWLVGAVVTSGAPSAAVILSTTDGTTWTPQPVPVGVTCLQQVSFADASNGWAAGCLTDYNSWSGSVVHTTNGGTAWADETPSLPAASRHPLSSVVGGDAAHAWVAGATPAYTSDGGATWTASSVPTGFNVVHSMSFSDVVHGFAGGDMVVPGASGNRVGAVWKTGDAGVTWTTAYEGPLAGAGFINAVAVAGANDIYGVGDRSVASSSDPLTFSPAAAPGGGVVVASHDGGVSWVASQPSFLSAADDITALNNDVWVAPVSGIVESTDGGTSWRITAGPAVVLTAARPDDPDGQAVNMSVRATSVAGLASGALINLYEETSINGWSLVTTLTTDATGAATTAVTPPLGESAYYADYASVDQQSYAVEIMNGQSTSTTLTMNPGSITSPGGSTTFVVHVAALGGLPLTGSVLVTSGNINSTNGCTTSALDSSGDMTLSCVWGMWSSIPVTVAYSGDSRSTASTSPAATVNIAGTGLTAVSLSPPAAGGVDGESVTVRATVAAGSAEVPCTATLTDNGTGVADIGGWSPGGTWSLTYVPHGVGLHTLALGTCNGVSGAATMQVEAAPAQLRVTGPASATAGSPAAITVSPVEGNGGVVSAYTGSVHFSSTDPQAVLPADYAFTAADAGSHTFSVVFASVGVRSVTVSDILNPGVAGTSMPVAVDLVSPDPAVLAIRGTDTALWVWSNSGGYVRYGGQLLAAPAPALLGDGNHLYVALGTDHGLWQRTDSSGWKVASPRGTYCQDSPALYAAAGAATIACMGGDRQLWVSHGIVDTSDVFHDGGWMSFGGNLQSGPSIALVRGQVHYYVEGVDHAVWDRTDATGFVATAWECLGHQGFSAVSGRTYFTCHGTDGQEWVAVDSGSGWAPARPLGGLILEGTAVAAYSAGATIYVEGGDKSVWAMQIDAAGMSGTGWRWIGGRAAGGTGASPQ